MEYRETSPGTRKVKVIRSQRGEWALNRVGSGGIPAVGLGFRIAGPISVRTASVWAKSGRS